MVTFWPIVQFGCLSAWSGVAARNSLGDQVRKRTTGRREDDAPAHPPGGCAHGLKQGVVLESTGSTVAPAALARRMKRLPAHTRHSLLAIATMAPRSAAVSVGLSPAAP